MLAIEIQFTSNFDCKNVIHEKKTIYQHPHININICSIYNRMVLICFVDFVIKKQAEVIETAIIRPVIDRHISCHSPGMMDWKPSVHPYATFPSSGSCCDSLLLLTGTEYFWSFTLLHWKIKNHSTLERDISHQVGWSFCAIISWGTLTSTFQN